MDWSKGFFRVWIVSSIMWAVGITINILSHIAENRRLQAEYKLPDKPFDGQDLLVIALAILLPIIGVYVLGRIVGWVSKGSSKNEPTALFGVEFGTG